MPCVNCNLELCYLCDNPSDNLESCCCKGRFFAGTAAESLKEIFQTETEKLGSPEKNPVGRPRMNTADMLDPDSAGRHIALRHNPIEPGAICEWANLKYAGGGVKPIIGCVGHPAKHRHHGPDKSVHNNERRENLHNVCHYCHNRWHANNDEFYGERPPNGEPFIPLNQLCLPHDPKTLATLQEKLQNEIYWSTAKAKRIDDPTDDEMNISI